MQKITHHSHIAVSCLTRQPKVPWASGADNFRDNLEHSSQGQNAMIQEWRTLTSSNLNMRGLIPVEARGPTRFAKVSFELTEVMRTLLVLKV